VVDQFLTFTLLQLLLPRIALLFDEISKNKLSYHLLTLRESVALITHGNVETCEGILLQADIVSALH
jgi:hypothetical protein